MRGEGAGKNLSVWEVIEGKAIMTYGMRGLLQFLLREVLHSYISGVNIGNDYLTTVKKIYMYIHIYKFIYIDKERGRETYR